MKTTATATMKGENEVTLKISAALQGAENNSGSAQATARDSFKSTFGDSIAAGFIWDATSISYVTTCQATPEACAPFAAYIEKKGLEIIQM